MKNKNPFGIFTQILAILLSAISFTGCATAQLEASGVYIAAEGVTAAILQHNPAALPTLQLLVADWNKFQGGTLTSTDEATLLQSIVTQMKGKLSATDAALLDGATQQVLANRNTTAPTPLQGAAGAILQTVMNGVARELVIYSPPTS